MKRVETVIPHTKLEDSREMPKGMSYHGIEETGSSVYAQE